MNDEREGWMEGRLTRSSLRSSADFVSSVMDLRMLPGFTDTDSGKIRFWKKCEVFEVISTSLLLDSMMNGIVSLRPSLS